jgi:thiamine kinase-like enzyme
MRNGNLGDCIEKLAISGRENEFYTKIKKTELNLRHFSIPQIYSVQQVGGFARTVMEHVKGQRVNNRYLRENIQSIAMAAGEINGMFKIQPEASAHQEIISTLNNMEQEAKKSNFPYDSKMFELIQQIHMPIGNFCKNVPLLFCHGDLHPGNMILSGSGSNESENQLFIIDWGAAGYSLPGTDLYVYAYRFPGKEHILLEAASFYKKQLDDLGIHVNCRDVTLGAMIYAFMKLGQRALRERQVEAYLPAHQVGENLRRCL